MAAAQRTDDFHIGGAQPKLTLSAGELTAEARRGAALARALIEHLSRMRAAGYDNELLVDDELWTVEVKRRSAAN